MEKLTFGVITYNQENFILDHLNSIKYQIENYGEKYSCRLIISDDCSSDNTVDIAKAWIGQNRNLFYDVVVHSSEINQGIVKNYVNASKMIDTEKYKILAGDDVYYKNNIFEIFDSNYDIVLTPILAFNDAGCMDLGEQYRFKEMLIQDDLKGFVSNRLKYSNCIDAPGVFLKHSLFDSGMISYLMDYTWVEDVPMWNYLFNKESLKVKIVSKIYVLYRANVGVSNNKAHTKRSGFESDEYKIVSNIHTLRDKFPYSMFRRWGNSFFKRVVKHYYNDHNGDICAFNKEIKNAENEMGEYLQYIFSMSIK